MLDSFFNPKKVVVIGASRTKGKIGNVIFENLLHKFSEICVNPKAEKILGKRCYPSILDVKEKVDLAVIATPAKTVPGILKECGEKSIKNIIIVSAGFKEVGNLKLMTELKKIIKKYSLNVIGPNCLGVFDAYSGLDTMFMLKERLHRPKKGDISLISQSGALGAMILDLASRKHLGFSKFVSYGNAVDVNETDILEYLGKDPKTKVICIYAEQIKDGQRFIKVARKIKKPIIFLKGGVTSAGKFAAASHTGSLAGEGEIYSGVLRQAGCIQVENIDELFILAEAFDKVKHLPKGNRVQVITNGGGYGINAADLLEKAGMKLIKPSKSCVNTLKKEFPLIVGLSNPMDLLGDSTNKRYDQAIKACAKDKNNDLLLVLVLTQVPLIDEKLADVIYSDTKKKPLIAVVTGTGLAEKISKKLKEKGMPCYEQINDAVTAIKGLVRPKG